MRTTFLNGLMEHKAPEPALTPAMQGQGQVWSALAEIGRQLQVLASAHTGQGSFVPASLPLKVYSPLSVTELCNEFLRAKARAERSDRYLRAIHYTLKKFTRRFGALDVAEVHTVEIEKWLFALNVEARTMHNYLGDVRTVFNFAVRRRYLEHNPAAGVELPDAEPKATAIHTPEKVRDVLNFARRYDLHICRSLAVRYFAGLRTCEVERIPESDIGPQYIEVSAATAKGARARRRRIVTIQPNLAEWLKLGGELPAPPQNGRRMLEFMRALKSRGVDWPDNVTRHSFCSYHLAKFKKENETAAEAGHSVEMLMTTYREVKSACGVLITKELAEEYFSILPTRPRGKTSRCR